MTAFRDAAAGRLDPFILVLEGAVANEALSGEGSWSALEWRAPGPRLAGGHNARW
jgi:hypothetical protein